MGMMGETLSLRVRVRVSTCVTLLKGENENTYRNKAVEAVSEARKIGLVKI